MEQNLEIICKNINHNFSPVILFCLNRKCKNKRHVCEECLRNFHLDHSNDCFNLQGIHLLIQREYQTLRKINHLSNLELVDKFQYLLNLLTQHLENIQNISERSDRLNDIITLAINCYNNTNYEELLSACLIYERSQEIQFSPNQISISLINEAYEQIQKEFKILQFIKKANELYELKKYTQAVNFYQISLKLQALQDDSIVKLCIALFIISKFEEAYLLYQKHYQVFQKSTYFEQMMHQILEERKNQTNLSPLFFDKSSQNITICFIRNLMHCNSQKESLESINNYLQLNPNDIDGIKLKVEILLRQKQFGLVKEFIDSQSKIKPDELQQLKNMCVPFDDYFFSEYKSAHYNYYDGLRSMSECKKNIYRVFMNMNPESHAQVDQADAELASIQQYSHQLIQSIEANKDQTQAQYGAIIQMVYYYTHGQFDKAEEIIDKFIRSAKNSRFFYIWKCATLLWQQKFKEALDHAKLAMYLDEPVDFYTRFYIYVLIMNDLKKEALKLANKLIDLNQYMNLEIKGKVLVQNMKFKEAQCCFKKMCELKPNDQKASLFLNQITQQIQGKELNQAYDSKAEKKESNCDIIQKGNSLIDGIEQFKFEFSSSELFDVIKNSDMFLMVYLRL